MTRPVDVLAVMDRQLEFTVASDYSGASDDHRDLLAARAAVAELIEADRDFDAAELELGNAKYGPYTKRLSRYTAAEKRRAAALANVGGAK